MVTMQDIADFTHVSRGTVSYVLNGKCAKAKISDATKARILEAANVLGYRRNAIAQSMKTGKTNVVGFIGSLDMTYCLDIIRGINDVVSQENYIIKLLPAENPEEVKTVARQGVEQQLDGVICYSLGEDQLDVIRRELSSADIPIVLVDNSFSHDWCSRVVSDDLDGARKATEYLLRQGHRRIAHVTNGLNHVFSRIRYDGFAAAMKEWNLEVAEEDVCIVSLGIEISELQRDRIGNLLRTQKPTAIFCSSDPLAMKVMAVTSEMGIRIPAELSVVGYGNLEYAGYSCPPLTSVCQPFAAMGREAGKILLEEITRPDSSRKEVVLPVELRVRKSVVPLRREPDRRTAEPQNSKEKEQ